MLVFFRTRLWKVSFGKYLFQRESTTLKLGESNKNEKFTEFVLVKHLEKAKITLFEFQTP